jgi:ATPase subunit of ABC transporter with duplicated ATPase domains
VISTTDLARVHGTRTLFEGANLNLVKGERYGIVGANGTGKSTLLRLLAGVEDPSEGDVHIDPTVRLGMLAQDHFGYEDVAILDTVMMGHKELWQAIQDKEEVLDKAEVHFDEDRYVELEDIVLRYDGYELESRACSILVGLGIPEHQHQQPMRVLSGGYKLRALLGQALCARPDAIVLDEPTNHLDILSIRWLEQYLQHYTGCAVVVSHDIRFLNRVCTRVLDIDYERITEYPGNYDAFEKAKALAREQHEARGKKREAEIAAQKRSIAKLKSTGGRAGQAASRQRQLDRDPLAPLPKSSRRRPRFEFFKKQRPGRIVLKAEGLAKAYGEKRVLQDVSFEVERGERVAILGANGVGKSTLLELLVGARPADTGTVEWGYQTAFGYFPQNHHQALGDPDQTVRGAMWEACPEDDFNGVMGRLAAVLFSTDDADKEVQHLSGGEAARLLFARLSLAKPEILILDEPTNHLDIESIRALSLALKRYDGTIVFVSHDRWFVNTLATRVLEIGEGGLKDFRGRYGAFVGTGGSDHLNHDAVAKKAKAARKAERKSRKTRR